MLFKVSQFLSMQSLPLYTLSVFSKFLNDDSVDIEKPDEICSLAFDVHSPYHYS